MPRLALPLAILSMILGQGAAAEPGSVEEILACVEKNLTHESAIGTLLLRSEDRVGTTTESRATLHWKRFEGDLQRVHVRMSDPPDVRGSALLLVERASGSGSDMFLYLPELEKVRRVTGRTLSGSLFGTDFTYEQFERMQGMARDVANERLPDAEVQERTVWVVAHTPDPEAGSQFERVVSYVDPDTCVPLRTDYFEKVEPEGEPRKTLVTEVGEIEKRGAQWVPRELVMRDLRDQTQTTLSVEELRLGVEIPRKMFSERNLARGR